MKTAMQRITAAVLLAVMLAGTAHAASPFPDVQENAAYFDAVEYLNDSGIMQGDSAGNFNPDKPVSRAEMAAIICRVLREAENLSTSSTFTDVPVSHWANKYVTKAASFGIIEGYGNRKFGPSDAVTFEQAVAMVIRMYGGEQEAVEAGGFPDGHISVANENDLLNGITSQKGEAMSRANIAIMLYNCIIG